MGVCLDEFVVFSRFRLALCCRMFTSLSFLQSFRALEKEERVREREKEREREREKKRERERERERKRERDSCLLYTSDAADEE